MSNSGLKLKISREEIDRIYEHNQPNDNPVIPREEIIISREKFNPPNHKGKVSEILIENGKNGSLLFVGKIENVLSFFKKKRKKKIISRFL